MENPFLNSAIIDLSNAQIVILRHKKQYGVTKCNEKAHLDLFICKAVGLKMYFIGLQATFYHTNTT